MVLDPGEPHLSRILSQTGTGPAWAVLDRRLEVAHRLLRGPGRPAVSAVAARCRSVSTSHPSPVFRECYGVPPAEACSVGGS
ncbi:Helix-turn-helix domain-containing protein [Quadrisphaera granulorum]|uniref:Helix-turn-helix protein n=1 Tax=Quadrisphaera granulorum TaxID=317664 RepID=A0A316A415_9ACTN|nr:helix-turn-helix protein [Quadrisphaera granulorum]SZE97453.1 Helix-turn-helix domain-containing protein [Quadrisphaera granulorum]